MNQKPCNIDGRLHQSGRAQEQMHGSEVIPVAAVEAAAAVVQRLTMLLEPHTEAAVAREILEAAAPHMRAQALEEAAAEVYEGVPAHGQEQYAEWLRVRAEAERTAL